MAKAQDAKKDNKKKFTIKRDKKYGGNLEYGSYEEIERDFIAKKLHPLDLKIAVAEEIVDLLKPIEKNRKELERLSKLAYD